MFSKKYLIVFIILNCLFITRSIKSVESSDTSSDKSFDDLKKDAEKSEILEENKKRKKVS